MKLKAPFPYFGGKSMIAKTIWQALGDPKRYIEPFFGSGSVLLNRPPVKGLKYEIVNDSDGLLANVWRALQFAPDEVAKWCDWPCNHADLIARKAVLVAQQDTLQKLVEDDSYFDVKLAGYWIWCASHWIGAGLTRPQGIPHLTRNRGVAQKIPHLTYNQGVAQKIPHLTYNQGVAQGMPFEKNNGGDVRDPYHTELYAWFRQLSERLRDVKVVCGDWTRVCGGNWQNDGGVCGIYFDPPYSSLDRDPELYDKESITVAQEVAKWALERGKLEGYRIVLSGYYEEHKWLLEHGWRSHKWKAGASYQGKSDNKNRFKETLFLSPGCNQIEMNLFEEDTP